MKTRRFQIPVDDKHAFPVARHDPGDEHAASMAESTLDSVRRILSEDHVLTKVCRHNLAVYRRKLDDAEDALPLLESVHQRFRDTLGPTHPYTLCSALNLSNVRWALGDRESALALDRATYAGWREVFGDDHPDTLNAAVNLVVSLDGSDPFFADLVAEKLREFADRHPRLQSVQPGQRVNCYIEPSSP